MNAVLESRVILLQLYCLYFLNIASCKPAHSHHDIDCLISNSERRALDHTGWKMARKGSTVTWTTPDLPYHLPQEGPPRTAEYDPTFGYEPYWAMGDWVFEVPPTEKGEMCGEYCSPHYRDYGVICGRKRDKKLNLEHKTFKNFCEMMNQDCDGKDVWLMAYRGECKPIPKTYPTQAISFVSRAEYYISFFMAHSPPTRIRRTRSRRHSTTTKMKNNKS